MANVNIQRLPISLTSFNTKYVLRDKSDVRKIKEKLCDQTFLNDLSLLFSNPSDYVNSIKYYPFNVADFVGAQYDSFFRLGETSLPDVNCKLFPSVTTAVLMAYIDIPRGFNNFMDNEPYTKIELYVPYFSFINLPVNEVMGKRINIYMGVDFDSGTGTIYLVVDDNVIMTSSTKLGIDIPLGASNLNEIVKENLANGMKVVAGISSMALAGTGKIAGSLLAVKGLTTAVTSGIDAVKNTQVRYTRGSASGGYDMLASPRFVYAIITRPNPVPIDSEYNHLKGKPLGEIKVLSQLRGFTIIDQIHLQNMSNALDEEMKEIESLLHAGVEL